MSDVSVPFDSKEVCDGAGSPFDGSAFIADGSDSKEVLSFDSCSCALACDEDSGITVAM